MGTTACNTRCYVSLHQWKALTAFYKWSNNSPLYRDSCLRLSKQQRKRSGGG